MMPPAAAADPVQADTSARWRALGTLVQLVVTDPRCLAEARRLLTADLDEVDVACSRFREDAEIRNLRTARGRPARVSPVLAEAIAVALRAARLTDGDVDPTVGAAMSAVGYDRDFDQVPRIGPPLPVTTRTVPGWREVHLEGQWLTMPAGIQLDLGATAKAWAADRAAGRIASRLGCGVLVSLGGDIAVAGAVPDGGWRVRVQDVTGSPEDLPVGPYALIAIHAGGLATSSSAVGSAAVTCCITSLTRAPAGRPTRSGVPSRSPRTAARTPTRRAPPRSSAAGKPWAGWRSSGCPPGWSM
jgi:thiamine biosynthesis lipoprotein